MPNKVVSLTKLNITSEQLRVSIFSQDFAPFQID